MSWQVHRFPILTSTNDLALEWMRAGTVSPFTAIVTEEQVAGRGRRGRSWVSPRGALLLTAVLPFYPERLGWTALAAGIAAARAARSFGAPAGVKWPNDVVAEGRKLAGTLVETAGSGLAAVGIGMNVHNPLPQTDSAAGEPTRLAEFAGSVDLERVLEAVLQHLQESWQWLAADDLKALREAWSALDTTRGRRVECPEVGVRGVAVGVADSGALRVRSSDGREVLAAVGDVRFLSA